MPKKSKNDLGVTDDPNDGLDDPKSEKSILATAIERLRDCVEREGPERLKQLADIKFVSLDQWPESIRADRENDVNGARPCLTIDKINQYRMQIINDIRKNRPAVKVRPVDGGADIGTAEIFQGMTRHIEDISTADIAYQAAAEWAIDCGAGYFRITTDYISDVSRDQEIYIKPIMDGFSVYLGPHVMPDGSDALYGFIIEDVPKEVFERLHPDAENPTSDLIDTDTESPFWVGEESVRKAEYFYYAYEPETVSFLSDGRDVFDDEYEKILEEAGGKSGAPTIIGSRKTTRRSVKWCIITANEILEKRDWAGKYIPIVKVVGHQKIVEGKKLTWGIVRPAIDSCRMYNYWASVITERLALSPKTPYIAAEGQLSGREQEWREINKSTLAVVQYKPIDINGNAIPPPQRTQPAAMESAMISQLQLIEHDIQTSLGMFKASVGQTEGDQSGIAIRSLQSQSDTATFHFPDNLAQSIRYGGRILIDLIPRIKDTAQIVRVLGSDGKAKQAQIDPNQPESMRQFTQDGKIKSIFNLNVGTYDVTVTVGPSFATKRMESVTIIQEAMRGNPQLVPIIGDLLFKNIDSPVSEEISKRMYKMLPPQLQDDEEGEAPVPPKAMAAMQQMQAKLQEIGQAAQELSEENQQLKSGVQVQGMKVQADAKSKQDALEVEKIVQGERQRLARDQFEFEKRLELDKARLDIELQKMKMDADSDGDVDMAIQKVQNLVMKHEAKMSSMIEIDAAKRTETAEGEAEAHEESESAQSMATMHQQFIESVGQIIEALQSKKKVSMTMPDGRTATAEVATY